jgi:phosphate transport system ATP-binding protein
VNARNEAVGRQKLRSEQLSLWRGDQRVLSRIDLEIPLGQITAILGPLGSGKSTLLRCFNRLHQDEASTRVAGKVLLDGENIDGLGSSDLRRRVGMVFNQPRPFSSLSIRDNVLSGLRLTGTPIAEDGAELQVERLLRTVGLWTLLRDRLNRPPANLTPGQLQRLCLARALALSPEVLLLDEPCWGFDPIETAEIEDVLQSLRKSLTLVLATHSLQHAARVSDRTAILLSGRLVEVADTERIFTSPSDSRTEDYITGRFSG